MMLITLKDICITYGLKDNRIKALENVSLQVEKSEFLVVRGKSGCGKSTLLNALGLIKEPSSGEYYFGGQNVLQMKDGEKARFRNRNIGFVVQHFALLNEQTISDNVALPLEYMRVKKTEISKRVDEMLELLELSEKKHAYPRELSGGQCQRVAIARALVTKPKLLLADEPTGALDEKTGKRIIELLQRINSDGTTIIMVTHDRDFATIGNRCLTMKDGEIVADENYKYNTNKET